MCQPCDTELVVIDLSLFNEQHLLELVLFIKLKNEHCAFVLGGSIYYNWPKMYGLNVLANV